MTSKIIIFLLLLLGFQMQAHPAGRHNILPDSSFRQQTSELHLIQADNQKMDSINVNQTKNVNAFSPNGDGYNDLFLKGYEITVFDRWGKELYKGMDGWDGNFNGNKVAAGTYFFIRHIRDNSGNIVNEHKGTVTLIRQ
ncbi:MAG: gliding motility-associated C-terminal domain-containing protein [Bacteroidales bacterium]|nr:gliding motility-associated C-terminal domain-containing protein [Bacteroidales bacterium]MCF8344968.1 gliding motility-associated C-terminal domain-containing protein [Bacteroidales bacterium]MCF8352379.1 gliding motility-associated C-terminal domain-containing protein [Bacteroidales bacterium]MCF8377000.1 gliding motility-associated C-terminal domain-containing protein [Bacteroidales bacterium]MCF8400847.1 gliding motility-associated C-terminal domain-containing protein [Bacteroidales bact